MRNPNQDDHLNRDGRGTRGRLSGQLWEAGRQENVDGSHRTERADRPGWQDRGRRDWQDNDRPGWQDHDRRSRRDEAGPAEKGRPEKSVSAGAFLLGSIVSVLAVMVVIGGVLLFRNFTDSKKPGKGETTPSGQTSHVDVKGKTIVSTSDFGRSEKTYDEHGNLIREEWTTLEGDSKNRTDYTYDHNNIETGFVSYFANGDVKRTGEFILDGQGHIIKRNYYDANHVLASYSEAELDSKGNAVKWNLFKADGSPNGFVENEYDANGNLTKSTDYSKEGTKTYCSWYTSSEIAYRSEGYNKNGDVTYSHEYEYNTEGICLKEKYHGSYPGAFLEETEFNEKGFITKKTELDGKDVKSYATYDFDDQGRLIKETRYHFDDKVSYTTSYQYDSRGRLTKKEKAIDDGTVYEKTEYDHQGELLSKKTVRNSKNIFQNIDEYDEHLNHISYMYYYEGEPSSFCEYEYDQNGMETKASYYDYNDGVKTISSIEENIEDSYNCKKKSYFTESGAADGYSTFEYNDSDRTKRENRYDNHGNQTEYTEYEYDNQDRETKKTTYNTAGVILKETETKYDSQGNRVEEIQREGGKQTYRSQCEYDQYGHVVKETSYDENNQLSSMTATEYDAYGNRIKRIYYNYNKDGSVSSQYEYEYDSAGHKRKETLTYSFKDETEVRRYDVDEDEIP